MSEETATSSVQMSESPTADLPKKTASVEFTVEPFVESEPGPHVKAAIAAAMQDASLSVDVGPFGTVVSGSEAEVLTATHKILLAAFSEGASRVSMQVNATTL